MQATNGLQEIDIRDYAAVTLSQWRVWVGTAIIAAAVGAIWALLLIPIEYRAATTIIVTGELLGGGVKQRVIEGLPVEMPGQSSAEAALCREILERETVRRNVVEECHLVERLALENVQHAQETLARRTDIVTREPGIVEVSVTLPGPPRVTLGQRGLTRQEAKRLVVRVASAYTEAARDYLGKLRLTAAKRKRVFVERRKEEVVEELLEAVEAVQEWEQAHTLIEPELVGRLATEGLIRLQQAQEDVRVQLKTARQRLVSLAEQQQKQPQMETASVVRHSNPIIAKMRERLVELESRLAVAQHVEGKAEQHPEVRAIQEELSSARKALEEAEQEAMVEASTTETASATARQVREELLAWQVNEQALEARMEGLRTAMHHAEQGITELSGEVLEYGGLVRTAKIKERLFETLAAEYEQALIDEQGSEPSFYILDEPVLPEHPVGPGPLAKIALAGLLGGLMGWVWVVGWGEGGREKSARGEQEE